MSTCGACQREFSEEEGVFWMMPFDYGSLRHDDEAVVCSPCDEEIHARWIKTLNEEEA